MLEQKFSSPKDEAIFGIGQYQFDVMIWKNGHMKLKQQNTAIASPVIVSNRGYGLFWDNYSFTEFNPEIETVELNNIDNNNIGTEFTPTSSGTYTFVLERPGSAPMEMTLNGKKVADPWRDRSPEIDRYCLDLDSGKVYDIKIEYYQNVGGASARLSWTGESSKTDNSNTVYV